MRTEGDDDRVAAMIGRWARAASLLLLGAAAIVDLGLAAAVLENAPRDLPSAWGQLVSIAGPGPRLALAGRGALMGGALAGAAAAAAALLLGSAASVLSWPAREVLLALVRLPAIAVVLLALLAGALLLGASGPVTAALAGFAVATSRLGAPWTLAVVLLPVSVALVEAAARRLSHAGFQSLATMGLGPWRRVFAVALPAILPAAIRAAVAGFVVAAAVLFVANWPVPARQLAVVLVASTLPARPLAALAFCAATSVAVLAAALGMARGGRWSSAA